MMEFKSGFSRTEITPPAGIELTGYVARIGKSIGLHDSLYSSAWVIKTSSLKLVIISCDILAFSEESVNVIRKNISRKIEVQEENIILIATHTHSGPATIFLRNCGKIDDEWLNFLHNSVVESVINADKNLIPSKIFYGKNEVNLSYNRNNPEGKIDRTVRFLRVDDPGGKPAGFFVVYSCHPVVLDEKNLYISSDYPHYIRYYLNKQFGENAIILFSSGASGDIDPIKRGSFEFADEFGKKIADSIMKSKITLLKTDKINFKKDVLKLKFEKIPSLKDSERILSVYKAQYENSIKKKLPELEIKIIKTFYEWAESLKTKIENKNIKKSTDTELSILSIDDIAFVFFPGEIFSEIGILLNDLSPYSETFFCGCSNGDIGYIGTEDACKRGGYEIDDAYKYYNSLKFNKNSGNIILRESLKLLHSMYNNR